MAVGAGLIAQTPVPTAASQWTWAGGGESIVAPGVGQPGVYGTLGVAAPGNFPGARTNFATWTDTSGNVWIFGGYGFDSADIDVQLNDLWEYNIATNEWAWMGGSNTFTPSEEELGGPSGVYGTLGVAAAGNWPGGRNSVSYATDPSGNFWLFGGFGIDAFGSETATMNDLWKFDPTTKEWTWMGGSNETFAGAGVGSVYGTLKTPASGNSPGGRAHPAFWVDASGNPWLFGGFAGDIGDPCVDTDLNDLWKFDPSSLEWAWMGGSQPGNPPFGCDSSDAAPPTLGVYGMQGTPAAANMPGDREQAATWIDASGNLWMFGGFGYASNALYGALNDMWELDPSTVEWTWWGGSNTLAVLSDGGQVPIPSVYGTLGTAAAANIPGARGGSATAADSNGDFWMFGGSGFAADGNDGNLNDLWKFSPSSKDWTWEAGQQTWVINEDSDTTGDCIGEDCGQGGVFGTVGVPSPANIAGGRHAAVAWTDESDHVWVFGGFGIGANCGAGWLNDLWVFQPGAETAPDMFPAITVTPTPKSVTTAQSVSVAINLGNGCDDSGPTGSVTLSSGTYSSAPQTVTGGTITIVIPAGSLAVGTDTLTATYTPDSTSSSVFHSATGSNKVTVTGSTTGSFAVSGTSLTFAAGATTGNTSPVTITPSGGFTGVVALTCSVASPNGANSPATCSFQSASVTISGATAQTGTLIVATTADTTPGAYSITITGTSGSIVKSAAVTATVTAAPAPVVSLSTTGPLTFTAAVGSTSAAQTVTLTNSGNAALTISSIKIAGTNPTDFAQTSTCGASLAASAKCAISVTFTPASVATFTAALALTDDAAASPQSITLNGTGTATPEPVVSLNTTGPLTFTAAVGATSATQAVTLTNTGNAALSIGSISITGTNPSDFAQTNSCGKSLAAGAKCAISVTFTPASATTFAASVSLTDNAAASPQSVTLSGTGTVTPAPVVSLSATGPLTFTTEVGTTSAAQTVTLTNTGNAALSISSVSITGTNSTDFAETNTCGTSVTAGAKCSIAITFTPASAATFTASVSLADNAAGSPQSVTLTGTGTAAPAPVVSLSATGPLTFTTEVGTTSAAQTVTLTNTGNAALSISSVSLTGTNSTDFAETNTCGTSVTAGVKCSIAITFTPASAATFTASISLADNATGSPQAVTLNGTGTPVPTFTVSSPTAPQTAMPGGAANYTIAVTPQNGAFTTAVALSASGLPSGATATFSPSSVTPGSSAANSTMTVQTAASTTSASSGKWPLAAPALAFVSLLLLPGIRTRRKISRWLALGLLVFTSLGALTALSGCGGGFQLTAASSGTSYTLTVTGVSGVEQQTTTVQLTVQ